MAQLNTKFKAPGPLSLLCLSFFSSYKLARSSPFVFLFLPIFSVYLALHRLPQLRIRGKSIEKGSKIDR